MYHSNNPILILTIFAWLLFVSCEKSEPITISNEEFSLDLWSGWTFQTRIGYDSYVGLFTNGYQEIEIDYGMYGFQNIYAIQETAETVYFEETTVDGFPAKIRKNNSSEGTILSFYIDKGNGYDMCILRVRNSENDERYIAIFKTFHFL